MGRRNLTPPQPPTPTYVSSKRRHDATDGKHSDNTNKLNNGQHIHRLSQQIQEKTKDNVFESAFGCKSNPWPSPDGRKCWSELCVEKRSKCLKKQRRCESINTAKISSEFKIKISVNKLRFANEWWWWLWLPLWWWWLGQHGHPDFLQKMHIVTPFSTG